MFPQRGFSRFYNRLRVNKSSQRHDLLTEAVLLIGFYLLSIDWASASTYRACYIFSSSQMIFKHLVREMNALHLCRNIHVDSFCLSSAYKTFCDVMEMKEVKLAGVQH